MILGFEISYADVISGTLTKSLFPSLANKIPRMASARLSEPDFLAQIPGIHVHVTACAGAGLNPLGSSGEASERIFPFSCCLSVTNNSQAPLRLMTRHLSICDAYHHLKELHGPCILGQRPSIQPGASYTFPIVIGLPTKWGSLSGSLRLEDSLGDIVDIPFERILLTPGSESTAETEECVPVESV